MKTLYLSVLILATFAIVAAAVYAAFEKGRHVEREKFFRLYQPCIPAPYIQPHHHE